MPSVAWQVRRTRADGLCWLRTIAAIAEPTAVENVARIDAVRVELGRELERWGEERWLIDVPWYGVRDWLWSEPGRADNEGSYDVCKRLLQQLDECHWFNHSVFYLASSLYHIDFFIVGCFKHTNRQPQPQPQPQQQQPQQPPQQQQPVYHRRILTTPIPRTKAAVWHSGNHYEPVVLSANDAATAFAAIYVLPQLSPPGSKCVDCDRARLEKERDRLLRQREVDVENDTVMSETTTRLSTTKRASSVLVTQRTTTTPTCTRRSRRHVKRPQRFLQQTTIPQRWRRVAALPQWTAAVNTAHAICIECFRLYTADECDVTFEALEPADPRATNRLQPGLGSHWNKAEGNDLHYALCRNGYCGPSRQKLLESVSKGLAHSCPTVVSPESDVDQVSGLLDTGMHMPVGGEREMWEIEQRRYPYLRVDVSGIPNSGRGVFVATTTGGGRTLHEYDVVCTMLGQIRAMRPRSKDSNHPLSFDLPLDTEFTNPGDYVYGLRLFPHTFAAIINSTYNTEQPGVTANCIFTEHPHFKQQQDHYVGEGVYPSGAFCVMVGKGETIEPGQELLLDYKWAEVLHTDNLD